MAYIDLMVLPVTSSKLGAYKKLVKKSAEAWKRAGALEYHEVIQDDVKPGKVTSFPQSVKLKKDEMVAAAYLVFESKAHRNKAWKAIMKDPFMAGFDWKNSPFDGKRMYYGGFKTLIKF
ncbi:DUF1428 domain-containing protein [Aestuariivirga litoralis]|uniref:DUF1428 domain-containing protein n=1 Tax=Aestuariivirga litoralis TaxID=2650924 RepID=UPI0018C57016|nr:DUF1428 family protein [Aestuariivirga litoralis]MBG1230816.1 DUF1428 family protein [Aestuariivirga litoralis]